MRRYMATGKTLDGSTAVAFCEADDYDDAKTTFRHGLYETLTGEHMIVRIDYRTVKEVEP